LKIRCFEDNDTLEAWIEVHRDELMAGWALASSGELNYKIEPL
jgi:hypothetical protein